VDRRTYPKGSVPFVKGRVVKPDLTRVERGKRLLIVKDVRQRSFFLRWTIGLWLIHKEWKIYERLAGVKGIPHGVERIDRFAFAMEYVPGHAVERRREIPPSFFPELQRVLDDIHARGVVHLDLRHKGNILVSEKGEPFLIDFNSSLAFGKSGVLRHIVFPVLQWIDRGGLLKLKERISPSSMTPEEVTFLKRFKKLRRFWVFN
jgi:serine/threonine protein kinase